MFCALANPEKSRDLIFKNPGIGISVQSRDPAGACSWVMTDNDLTSRKCKTHTQVVHIRCIKKKKVYTFWSTWIWLFLEGENCTWSDWTRHNPLLYSISFINRDQIRLDIIQLNHVVFSNTKCVETYVKVQIGSDFSSKERNAPGQIGQDMICAWSPFFMTSYLIGWEYQTILSMTHIKFKLVEK